MKVIVAAGTPGFIGGGAAELAFSVDRALRAAGHEVELLWVPSYEACEESSTLLPQLAGLRIHDYADEADHLIALRWPAHYLRHPRKTVWFLHEFRTLFDLAGYVGEMGSLQPGDAARATVLARWERLVLDEARAVFSNSQVVADRARRSLGGFEMQVLEPPYPREIPDPFPFAGGSHVVLLGRVAPIKRADLAIRAVAASPGDWTLTIAGVPDPPAFGVALQTLVDDLGVAHRVNLRLDWISEDEKLRLLEQSAAVLNLAFAEDSYSYVTYEGWAAGRPVITVSDSEGIAHAIGEAGGGVIAEPNPTSLAAVITDLLADPVSAAAAGGAGRNWVTTHGTTWDDAIARLLA